MVGAARLAVGRRDGIERFGDSPQAFLASLAPLVAFQLVGGALIALSGSALLAATLLLFTAVAQLGPLVLSHWLAVRWGREAAWLRYATAFNWCQWAIPVAGMAILLAAQLASGGRLGEEAAAAILLGGLGLYGLWLHWFVARHGLLLGRGRAAALVALVNAGTVVLVMGPQLVQLAVNGSTS